MRDTGAEAVKIPIEPPPAAVSPRYRIQAIERAVAILNAFSVDDPELGVTELAERVGLHKSTVHRFMVNLDAAGLVERNPRTGRYRLGLHIFELGGLVMQQMNLWDEALPFLESLVRHTGETGHLAVLDGGRRSTSSASRHGGRCGCPRPSAAGTRPTRRTSARSCSPTSRVSGWSRSSPSAASPPTPEHDHRPRCAGGRAREHPRARIRDRRRGVRRGPALHRRRRRDHSGHVVSALGIGGRSPGSPRARRGAGRPGHGGRERPLPSSGRAQSGAYAPATLRVRNTASETPAVRHGAS